MYELAQCSDHRHRTCWYLVRVLESGALHVQHTDSSFKLCLSRKAEGYGRKSAPRSAGVRVERASSCKARLDRVHCARDCTGQWPGWWPLGTKGRRKMSTLSLPSTGPAGAQRRPPAASYFFFFFLPPPFLPFLPPPSSSGGLNSASRALPSEVFVIQI